MAFLGTRDAGTGSLSKFSSREHVRGCVKPQASLLCGAQSSHDISSSHYPHPLLFLLLSAPSSQGHYVRSVYLV